MAHVMREQAQCIRLEPPGPEGQGAEFWLNMGDTKEYHQVKRQRSQGSWTLPNLHTEKVLFNFWVKLTQDPTARCVFVSTEKASQLAELSDRARDAADAAEFQDFFLTSKTVKEALATLRTHWDNCSLDEAYLALRRIHIRNIDEETLNLTVESTLDTLVEAEPSTMYAELAKFALDQIHQELTPHKIWHHIETLGYRRREWGKDSGVLAAVDTANAVYIDGLQEISIRGHLIPRIELADVLKVFLAVWTSGKHEEYLANARAEAGTGEAAGDKVVDVVDSGNTADTTVADNRRAVIVSGPAGIGKSGVILAAVETLKNAGVPMLCFRVDRREPVQFPDQLGRQLDLPGSPVSVLASIAQGGPCVLVIDQLDAVSLSSGRNPGFFDCIHLIIKQALAHPNMCLLIACRKFDLESDSRLQRLIRQEEIAVEVPVSELSADTVLHVISEAGLEAKRLSDRQVSLLSVPLHLSLLLQVAEDHAFSRFDFQTANDLYDSFWRYKRRTVGERLGRPVNWTQVIDALCDYMSKEQDLTAPKDRVDAYEDDAQAMASEHVLSVGQGRYAFFHEGFFDYAFARRFAERGQNLMRLLHTHEQHLFRRAQVRQILTYARVSEPIRYYSELRAVLSDPDTRFHIKQVVFRILQSQIAPTLQEWQVLSDLIESTDDILAVGAWNSILRSESWFDLIDRQGIIAKWLSSSNEVLCSRTIMLLSSVQKERADRVAELLEQYAEAALDSDLLRNHLTYLVSWADLASSRRFLDLVLHLIDTGVLDQAKGPIAVNSDFWHLIHSLPEKQPAWAAEVMAHYLNRRWQLSKSAGHTDFFASDPAWSSDSGNSEDDLFLKAASGAPHTFVEQLLPFMLDVVEHTAQPDSYPPWQDPLWSSPMYGPPLKISYSLLAAMRKALSLLVVDDPGGFAQIAARLGAYHYDTINYLLISAYTAGAQICADEAAEYLCAVEHRLHVGYGGWHGDEEYWVSRELIQAISPNCSEANLSKLEETILSFYPARERKKPSVWPLGRAQLVLLEAIDPLRRSSRVIRRLGELQRKFEDYPVSPPHGIRWSRIKPPISPDRAAKMSDQQWLRAIRKYNGERHGINGGSASELSSLLGVQVREQPERFANLLLQFPADTNPEYFGSMLMGLAEVGLDTAKAAQLLEHCHTLPGDPAAYWITNAISVMAEQTLPEQVLELVSWYVANGNELARTSAVECVAQLITHDATRISYFIPALDLAAGDPSTRVRGALPRALVPLLDHDGELATALFLRLATLQAGDDAQTDQDDHPEYYPPDEIEDTRVVEEHDAGMNKGGSETRRDRSSRDPASGMLSNSYSEIFLLEAVEVKDRLLLLLPLLHSMVHSTDGPVARVGARVVSKGAAGYEEAQSLAVECVDGTEAQQGAAAEVLARNVSAHKQRAFCESMLIRLFDSDYSSVRAKAATCFSHLWGEELDARLSLVNAFIESKAFAGEQVALLHALKHATVVLPSESYRACKRFFEHAGPAVGNVMANVTMGARTVLELLIRVYGYALHSGEGNLQTQCLDLIDHAAIYSAFGLEEALTIYERQ